MKTILTKERLSDWIACYNASYRFSVADSKLLMFIVPGVNLASGITTGYPRMHFIRLIRCFFATAPPSNGRGPPPPPPLKNSTHPVMSNPESMLNQGKTFIAWLTKYKYLQIQVQIQGLSLSSVKFARDTNMYILILCRWQKSYILYVLCKKNRKRWNCRNKTIGKKWDFFELKLYARA